MNNRLKLYDTRLNIRLNKKEKNMLRKNAYKNNLTMSDYVRTLILIDNRKKTLCNQFSKIEKLDKEIKIAKVKIRRDI